MAPMVMLVGFCPELSHAVHVGCGADRRFRQFTLDLLIHEMPRITPLDKQWEELMFLCGKESDFRKNRRHPKVLKLVTQQIDELAAQMGFSLRQIKTREFRSERSGGHIVRIVKE